MIESTLILSKTMNKLLERDSPSNVKKCLLAFKVISFLILSTTSSLKANTDLTYNTPAMADIILTAKESSTVKVSIKQLNKNTAKQNKKTVEGIINDENGNCISGVSVVAKGTAVGVISDINGNYTIVLPKETKVMVFSFVGMKTTEVQIGTRSMIDIVLKQETQDVDEVIVIAYGTTKKKSFTGSAKSLNQIKISTLQTSDVSEVLQGNVSGVEVSQWSGSPGDSPSIRIRGVGSINASSEPLIVVDGVPYGNSLNTINPLDIERISVLKDASATALYGSRAANGVILITSKKGNKYRTNVNFSAQWGVSSRAVPGYKTVGAKDYYELMWQGLYTGYNTAGLSNPAELASQNLVGSLVYNPFNNDQPVGVDGKLKPEADLLWQADWSGNIFNKGKKQEYGLAFSGGSEKSQYYMSLGYLHFDGILVNSNFKRYTARLDNQKQIFDWLKVGTNFAGSTTVSNKPVNNSGNDGSIVYQASVIPSIYPIYLRDEYGEMIMGDDDNPRFDYGVNGDEDGRDQRPYWALPRINSIGSEQYDKNTTNTDQLSFRTFADISFFKGLTWKATLSYDFNSTSNHYFLNPSYGKGVTTNGLAKKSEGKHKVWNINNILIFDKKTDQHSFNILAGHERYKLKYSYLVASKTNFAFENIDELAGGSVISDAPNSFVDNYRVESFLSRINYDFANKYYISLSYRADGSSRFNKDVRWGNFWSVGTSWRISQEDFMQSTGNWLDDLKLKTSYGTLGNDNLGTYYAYQQLYSTGHNNLDKTGVQISRLGTPDLTWEISKTSNIGIEVGLFNRFNFELELFKRKVEDMLFARPLPLSAGITSIDENIGDMQNTGIEVNLFAKLIKKKNFYWNFDINSTHYKNKITRLVQEEIISGNFKYELGGSAYDFYMKEWAGVNKENGDPLYYIGDKDSGERETVNSWFSAKKNNLGSALPDLFGGFTNTFHFKGIEVTALFNYKLGGKVYDVGSQLLTHSGIYTGLNLLEDVLDYWTPENNESEIPAMNSSNYHGNITSSRYIFDTSYLRLRNLSLSYSLDHYFCSKMKIQSCKISLIGQNLFTISGVKGFDPEAGFSNVSNHNYPQLKVVSLALSVTL